jgi:Beta-glucosidase-related glycosidases
MTAHVAYPALDSSGLPATLSRKILNDLLRDKIGFSGLVVTDALIMEGVLGGGEATAVVRALAAGCDLLLYPAHLALCIDAVNAAVERGDLDRTRLGLSLERRRRWAEWANSDRHPATITPEDTVWAERLCDRVVHPVRGAPRTLSGKVEVIVVDDDLGGPYPPPSREPFFQALAAHGLKAEVRDTPSAQAGAEVIIALFGDIRSWKGRPGYSTQALDDVGIAVERAGDAMNPTTIVQFSHPRLAPSIPGNAPILCAWGGEAVMQRAAARALAGPGTTTP